ncbi:MAG: prepilin-type N-terminal cleavage/methylation domain-containing protein, partial [Bacilli bacterium]|nr:prepilin-type N-terminal cleavage/methylation domain-containing protein [Bacilli bacterium]
MGNRNNTKAFTLVELLTVIILLGLIITLAIPTLRNLTYNGAEKQYQYHQKLVHEAAKIYAKNYRGELDNNDSSCFNIPYYALLQEDLIEEEDTKCSGSIILEKRGHNGYNYNYYLTCKDVSGEVLHESDPIPLSCKEVSGSFKVSYQLYQDNGKTPYTEGDWAKEVYAEYNSSSPYNYPIDYFEYSVDFINWTKIEDHSKNYTNYVGNVFVRAVDKGDNISEVIRHLVRTDSLGPTFVLKSNENEISDNNLISI